ncbi:hypothetical protein Dsin_032251 [Dipteronia sinensis]|uniref:RNase H type-1 domain-containing protein n=1 Tax=Dipteronia sinensis TaxID=43782 RepID=A0AAD9ZNZ6_9ROSI|nr:hypothetical protein Dsin_032251 [Dipteronia sinensis]
MGLCFPRGLSPGECGLNGGMIGLGLIIRDNVGSVMCACAQPIHAGYSPLIAEAIAILSGLRFALESGLIESAFGNRLVY